MAKIGASMISVNINQFNYDAASVNRPVCRFKGEASTGHERLEFSYKLILCGFCFGRDSY